MICEVPTQKEPLRFAVPEDLVLLLNLFDGHKQIAEVAAAYSEVNPGKYQIEKIENLVDSFFLPKRLLIDVESPSAPLEHGTTASYLYAKVGLIPSYVAYPVALTFGWLFKKPIMVAWLLIFVIANFVFFLHVMPGVNFNVNNITSSQFLQVAVLTIIGAFIHEMGHASALATNGGKHTEIGVGLYLHFPVLYTNVSEAWKLSRSQRVVVDIAGIYFQSIFLVLLLCLYFITKSSTPLYGVFLINVAIANSLSPFLRMDGYWLVADLFGIYNLRAQSGTLFKHYASKLIFPKRESVAAAAPLSNLTRTGRIVLCVYTVLSIAFFIFLFTVMFRQAIYYMIPNYPTHLLGLWRVLHEDPVSVSKVLKTLFEVLWKGVVLFGLLMFFYRSLLRLWSALLKALRSDALKLMVSRI